MKKEFFMLTEDEIESLVERISNKLYKSFLLEQSNKKDELLTIDEAAKLIKLSKATIYGLVHKKSIPHCKKGKRLYFQKSELLEWIQSGRKATVDTLDSKVNGYLLKNRI
jgi:excisionase family DNA binding protein